MKYSKPQAHFRWLLLGATLTAAGSLALLSGCKGNTTSAALPEHHVGPPPVLVAMPVTIESQNRDLTSSGWQATSWMPFSSTIDSTLMTPSTRAAALYSPAMLYLAAISTKSTDLSSTCTDSISFYLDTQAAGKELLEVRTDPTGKTVCTWMRSNAPAQPLEDGSPNLGFPVFSTPNIVVKGLTCQTTETTTPEGAAWTAVVGIPLASLPTPMQVAPKPGTAWKLNIVRTITQPAAGGTRTQRLESNLSPIFSGAQAVSPYRMAELQLAQP